MQLYHKSNIIHRDIKTENIFVATDGRLVLGDFGIVFFKSGHERVTETYEKVGTSFWMAPWAYRHKRLALDEIDPTLDIFPLAKVLWSMVAGRNGLAFWELTRDENNLELMFPDDTMMPRINRVLASCIARDEEGCKLRALGLLEEVDRLIAQARRLGQKPDDDGPWPCRMCGRGRYRDTTVVVSAYATDTARIPFKLFVCDHCHHTEMFRGR